MSKDDNSPLGVSWDEYKKTIFTPAEIATCDLKVAEKCKQIEARADVIGEKAAAAEAKADIAVQKAMAATKARGNPVALYDAELKMAYFEFPDGSREYDFMTELFKTAVNEAIATTFAHGNPVARYDVEAKKPYMEHPDGHREYR